MVWDQIKAMILFTHHATFVIGASLEPWLPHAWKSIAADEASLIGVRSWIIFPESTEVSKHHWLPFLDQEVQETQIYHSPAVSSALVIRIFTFMFIVYSRLMRLHDFFMEKLQNL